MSFNNVGVLGFHIMTSRILGPAGYGAAGSVLALTTIVQVGSGALHTAVTRIVASQSDVAQWDTRRLERVFVLGAAVFVAVGFGARRAIESYLHLHSAAPVASLLVLGAAVIMSVVPKGLLLGHHRFLRMSLAVAAGAVIRPVLGAVLATSFGVTGAVAAAAAAEVATASVAVLATIGARRRLGGVRLRVPVHAFGLAVGAYGGLWVMTGADVFLARHLLSTRESGLYVAASTAASMALYLPYNVTSAVFPAMVADATTPDTSSRGNRRRRFHRNLSTVAGLAIVAALTLMLMANLVISELFGSSFRGAGSLLVLLAVSNGAQGVIGFVQLHQLALHRRSALVPWLGLVALVVAANVVHNGPRQIAAEAVIASVAVLLVMAVHSSRLAANTIGRAMDT